MLDESLTYCMDYEYWLRLGSEGVRFGYLEKKLAGSRLYPDNKTLGARVKVHEEINDMLKKLTGKVPDRWLFNYAHAVVESRNQVVGRPELLRLKVIAAMIGASLRWNRTVSMRWAARGILAKAGLRRRPK